MTTRNITSTHLQNLLNSSNGLVVGTPGTQIRIYQRTTTPPALPSLTSAATRNCEFFNEQTALVGGYGYLPADRPLFSDRGVRFGQNAAGDLSSGMPASAMHLFGSNTENKTCRPGVWWSEGIIEVRNLLDTTLGRYLDEWTGLGSLRISYVSGAWRFVVDSNGTDHVFSSITIPVTSIGVGAVPQPFYYRMVREMPSSGTGQIHLVVNDGTTTQQQTITGVTAATVPSSSTNFFGDVVGTFDSTKSYPEISVFWWRGTGTDTTTTLGTYTGTFWSTPAVFGTETYTSSGSAGVVDAEADDEYWHTIGVVQGGQFTGLRRDGGGLLQARVAATNTAPTGDTSSLFSGSFFGVQNVPEALSDPQGRYLALQLKYTPGSEWPLSSGSVVIAQDSNVIMTASHFDTPSGSSVIPLPVTDEGSSEATLPYIPEVFSTQSTAVIRSTMDFEFPYTVARPLATGSRRSYSVTWVLTESERDTLVAFFESRNGSGTFTWTAPGDSTTSLAALTSPITISQTNPGAYVIQATLTEVL